MSVLPCFGDFGASFVFIFIFLSLSLHVCCFLILRVSFHPSLHFSCAGMRMQRKTGTGDNRTESRTRDRNGTRVFRSTEVLSGNRRWKNRKKTHIFVIKRENTSDFFGLVSPKCHIKNISLDPKCT